MKSLNQPFTILGLIVLFFQWNVGCPETRQYEEKQKPELNIAAIEQVTEMKGTEQNGEYKLTVPQNDLDVTVDEFAIIPPMGMGSWAAFSPVEDGAILMGDIVVRENEIAAVQQTLIEHGLKVTALHNHFVREQPGVKYMHIGGHGTETELGTGVKAVFDNIAELRGGNPAEAEAGEVENTLDTERIDEILGHEGAMNRGVYKTTIGRPDVNLIHHGHRVSTFMGFNTWAAWQGRPENAAVAGDFVMLADEVEGVIEALVNNGIEVVALHNHMIHEEPRVFFLHYWGTGPAEELAQGLRKALDQTGTAPGSAWNFEGTPEGSFPAGWKTETTNPDRTEGTWNVTSDPTSSSGSKVLKLTDTGASSGGTYNIAWTDQVSFANGTIEVKVKAGTGREDQGGGPIWRVQDKNNYYIARWNPLEDNFRLYYVKDGDRVQIASAAADLPTDRWHAIKIEQEGSKIEGYLDGEKKFEVNDQTLVQAGGVGVWTKADAATSFDDLVVRNQ